MRYVFAAECSVFVLALFALEIALVARIRWGWLRIAVSAFIATFFALVALLCADALRRVGSWRDMHPTLTASAWACVAAIGLGATALPLTGLWRRGAERRPIARAWRPLRLLAIVAACPAVMTASVFARDAYVKTWIKRVREENQIFIASVSPPRVDPEEDAAPAYLEIYREILRIEASRAEPDGLNALPPADETELPEWLADVVQPAFDFAQPEAQAFRDRHRSSIAAIMAASRRKGAVLRPPGSTMFDDDNTRGADALQALHRLVSLEARIRARERDAVGCWECLACLERLQRHVSSQGGAVWAQIGKALEAARMSMVENVLAEPALDAGSFPFPLPEDDFSHLPVSTDGECLTTAQMLEIGCAVDLCELDGDPRFFSDEEQFLLQAARPVRLCYAVYHRVFVLADGLGSLPAEMIRYRRVAAQTPDRQSAADAQWLRENFDGPGTSELAWQAWTAPLAIYYTSVAGDAKRRLAVAGIAVAGFQARNRRDPSSLNELVPEFLVELPLDPWDGKPLRMRRIDGGIAVYSVGENRVDDGGADDSDPIHPPDQAFFLGGAFQKRRIDSARNEP